MTLFKEKQIHFSTVTYQVCSEHQKFQNHSFCSSFRCIQQTRPTFQKTVSSMTHAHAGDVLWAGKVHVSLDLGCWARKIRSHCGPHTSHTDGELYQTDPVKLLYMFIIISVRYNLHISEVIYVFTLITFTYFLSQQFSTQRFCHRQTNYLT